jgi:predicted transcriptional regulator
MTSSDVSSNLLAIIQFASVVFAALFSWLAEHAGWFNKTSTGADRSPLFKRVVVTAVMLAIGILVTGLGTAIDPEKAAALNVPLTALVAFVYALVSAIITHGGINQILPALIELLRALAEARKVGPAG